MTSLHDAGHGRASFELQSPTPPGLPSSKDTSDTCIAQQVAGQDKDLTADVSGDPEAFSLAHPQHKRWNHPRANVWRTFACFLGLLIMGMNDAAYGALIPYLETYYKITYTIVSLVFLSPLVGYTVSALTNNHIHMTLGQRGVAFLGPGVRLLSYIIISQHPPYPVLVLAFVLAGFGNGLEDAAWNAWIGNMQNANEILGFLHGSYGFGAVLSPIIATTMVTKARLEWYIFYYILIGAAVFELAFAVTAFWTETGQKFRDANPRSNDKKGGRTKEALGNRVTWICSVFLLIYVGIEVALGGWVVVFMMEIRHATPFAAGVSATGFWVGITLGRIVLGFVTPKIGEKLAIFIYLALATVFHLVFYLVPSLPVSFTAVALEGFFLGPLFPAAVVAAAKILPQHLHVAAIGFAAAFGACGACILPFAVGAIAQAKGVQVLMPIVLAMLVADGAVWALLPGLKRDVKQKEEREGEHLSQGKGS
ncbi:hypothetical protein MMC24_004726 [Lignoscripta atroalba]|nr:hypothetical protein [Lignoscripta atroalba]